MSERISEEISKIISEDIIQRMAIKIIEDMSGRY